MNEYYWCLNEKVFILNLCYESDDRVIQDKDYHLNTVIVFSRINEKRLGENLYACLHKGIAYGMLNCTPGFIAKNFCSFGDPVYETQQIL